MPIKCISSAYCDKFNSLAYFLGFYSWLISYADEVNMANVQSVKICFKCWWRLFNKLLFWDVFSIWRVFSSSKKSILFLNQGSSGESAKPSSQLEYSVYVLHHGRFFFHVLGQLTISELLFCACFKVSPHSKSFIWRSVLFAWKWTRFSWIVLQKDSFWHRGRRQLWNGLFIAHLSDVLAGNISANAGKSHWKRKIRLDKKP